MMKGANRKLFRKPGLARQAIGILASSKELADQVQQVAPNMMPQQPVQNFRNGGLASMLGITPAGYEMQGEELVARPGFSGFYERASGISDPVRAREQSALDLIKLGARIAGGESTSATTNIAKAITESAEDLAKNRQTEFAMTLKEAEMARALDDAKLDREYKDKTLALSRFSATTSDDLLEAYDSVGITIKPGEDGQPIATYKGKQYSSIQAARSELDPADESLLQAQIGKGTLGSAGERDRQFVLDRKNPLRERFAVLSGIASSNDPIIREDEIATKLEAISQQRSPSGRSFPTGALRGNNKNAIEIIQQTFGVTPDSKETYYITEDSETNELILVDTSARVIGTNKNAVATLKELNKQQEEEPKPETEPETEPEKQNEKEPFSSLNLTPQERKSVSQDMGLQRAERDLQRAEERLDAALAGTRNLDTGAIEKQVETHKRRVEREYQRLLKEIENKRKRAEKGPRTRS